MPKKSPLPDIWKVPQLFRTRLGERVGRQRAMFADGHLLLVLHAVPKPDEDQRVARLFWRAPDGSWQSNKLGPGIKALQKHLNDYAEVLERLEEAEEQGQRADDFLAVLHENGPLQRAARNLYTTLQEARQFVPEDRDVLICRDRAYAIHRAAELLQNDTRNDLDADIARRAEQQAEHSHKIALAGHRLNLMAAAFLPIATLASVFGMNLDHGLHPTLAPWPFWAVLAAGIFLGLLLRASLSNKPR